MTFLNRIPIDMPMEADMTVSLTVMQMPHAGVAFTHGWFYRNSGASDEDAGSVAASIEATVSVAVMKVVPSLRLKTWLSLVAVPFPFFEMKTLGGFATNPRQRRSWEPYINALIITMIVSNMRGMDNA